MSMKIITAALAAATLLGLAASSSASAQSYGGVPACAYSNRCVETRAPRYFERPAYEFRDPAAIVRGY